MNHIGQRLTSGQRPFWKRILERHKFRGHLLRARVPLVLFRFWSPRDSRQARTGLRPPVAQHPLALHIQLFWPQWLRSVSGPRVVIEKSTFSHSVIKELKQVLINPRRTATSAALRPDAIARPSAETGRKPDGIAGGRRPGRLRSASTPSVGSVASVRALAAGGLGQRATLRNTFAHSLRDEGTSIQATLRPFTETLLKHRLHSVFAERHGFAPPVALIAGPAQRGQSISAGGTSPPPFEAAAVPQVISRRDGVTRALRRNVDVMPHVSTPLKSRLADPAQTEGDGPDSLGSMRSRLYAQSAWLNLANQPAYSSAERLPSQEQLSPARPPFSVQALQPQLDIGRLSEEVYRHIQRKIRVERERRGI